MGRIYKTRFPELTFTKVGAGCWRVLSPDGNVVGPLYKTKGELLGDLARYARDCWGLE